MKRNRLTDVENKLVSTSGERKRGEANRFRELRGANYYV